MPGDLGPFKGCYLVTSTERSFSPRSKKRLETSKHPINGRSGVFLFELIGINRGMIEKVGQNLSPKVKHVGIKLPIKLRGERDVICLRNLTEDRRAFRRMLTNACRVYGIQPWSIGPNKQKWPTTYLGEWSGPTFSVGFRAIHWFLLYMEGSHSPVRMMRTDRYNFGVMRIRCHL